MCPTLAHGRASEMPSIQSTDTPQLREVKERIIELIGNFSRPSLPPPPPSPIGA